MDHLCDLYNRALSWMNLRQSLDFFVAFFVTRLGIHRNSSNYTVLHTLWLAVCVCALRSATTSFQLFMHVLSLHAFDSSTQFSAARSFLCNFCSCMCLYCLFITFLSIFQHYMCVNLMIQPIDTHKYYTLVDTMLLAPRVTCSRQRLPR